MPSSLFALIDDVTSVLDDVALLAKVATKQSTGVVGDDLALNALQVAGVQAERELPVVWAVAKGSLKNKAILVPIALTVSAVAPWLVTPLLVIGGTYLCYEAFEKIVHRNGHTHSTEEAAGDTLLGTASAPPGDLAVLEKEKIRGAVRTDFILSAEIIAIALGTVADKPLVTRAGALAVVAVAMTVFVYGLVAAIVKLDDLGLHLSRRPGTVAIGRFLLAAAPVLLKSLTGLGTIAMFMVGGGILTHGVAVAHTAIHAVVDAASRLPLLGRPLAYATPTLLSVAVGAAAGAASYGAMKAFNILRNRRT
jgi:predicted DNA repair protein MutK